MFDARNGDPQRAGDGLASSLAKLGDLQCGNRSMIAELASWKINHLRDVFRSINAEPFPRKARAICEGVARFGLACDLLKIFRNQSYMAQFGQSPRTGLWARDPRLMLQLLLGSLTPTRSATG
jgi:hypothetical protein